MEDSKYIIEQMTYNILYSLFDEYSIDSKCSYIKFDYINNELSLFEFDSIDEHYLNLSVLEANLIKKEFKSTIDKFLNEVCTEYDVKLRTFPSKYILKINNKK